MCRIIGLKVARQRKACHKERPLLAWLPTNVSWKDLSLVLLDRSPGCCLHRQIRSSWAGPGASRLARCSGSGVLSEREVRGGKTGAQFPDVCRQGSFSGEVVVLFAEEPHQDRATG